MHNSYSRHLAAAAALFSLLLVGCASGTKSTQSARSGSYSSPKCGPGDVLMCQTRKTGFGRLSTGSRIGNNRAYDYCTCEPSSVVIHDDPMPR